MKKLLKACWCFVILGLIWQGLELLLYGQVQPRIVYDIMVLLLFPFIYQSSKVSGTISNVLFGEIKFKIWKTFTNLTKNIIVQINVIDCYIISFGFENFF